jgi:hypothetical protein
MRSTKAEAETFPRQPSAHGRTEARPVPHELGAVLSTNGTSLIPEGLQRHTTR